MHRVGSWLYGRKSSNNTKASLQSLELNTQIQDLEQALQAATLIINDDFDGAVEGLSKGDSSFHKTGRGVVFFLRSMLEFEQEKMREASERLSDAETSAYNDQQRVNRASNTVDTFHSKIYGAGTEYAVCHAMAQVMNAIIGVLNESITDSLKGFYKLRKAYGTLDGILRMEERYLQSLKTRTTSTNSTVDEPLQAHSSRSDLDLHRNNVEVKLAEYETQCLPASTPSNGLSTPMGENDADSTDIFSHPIDAFIHSSASLCLGALLTALSTLPPTFSHFLAILGFRGDKERGLRMLWQASKYPYLIGAISGMGILDYYNGFVRLMDIIPDIKPGNDEEIEGYPKERLLAVLNQMRARYPKSQMWLLQESRMKGANYDVKGAMETLKSIDKSPLKQVEALHTYESSMISMFLHRYEDSAKCFIEYADLNTFSPALYYYLAGSSYIVLYQQTSATDSAATQAYAEKAREYIRKVSTVAGKKSFMSRPLPFEVFITRKIAKWEARAKELKVDLIDAVSVDPVEEMILFWNGYSRMEADQLEESLRKLVSAESSASFKDLDENDKAINHLLQATILRSLRRHTEAKEILKQKVLVLDRSVFKGSLGDNWVLPSAHFELAVNLWMERPSFVPMRVVPWESEDYTRKKAEQKELDGYTSTSIEREKVQECESHIEKVAKWESYELDFRVGSKLATAKEAIQRWYASHPVEK